jgi:hypothetical protein
VVNYGELCAGVLAATDVSVRSRRPSTLQTPAELHPTSADADADARCIRVTHRRGALRTASGGCDGPAAHPAASYGGRTRWQHYADTRQWADVMGVGAS